eukprot:g10060.t1
MDFDYSSGDEQGDAAAGHASRNEQAGGSVSSSSSPKANGVAPPRRQEPQLDEAAAVLDGSSFSGSASAAPARSNVVTISEVKKQRFVTKFSKISANGSKFLCLLCSREFAKRTDLEAHMTAPPPPTGGNQVIVKKSPHWSELVEFAVGAAAARNPGTEQHDKLVRGGALFGGITTTTGNFTRDRSRSRSRERRRDEEDPPGGGGGEERKAGFSLEAVLGGGSTTGNNFKRKKVDEDAGNRNTKFFNAGKRNVVGQTATNSAGELQQAPPGARGQEKMHEQIWADVRGRDEFGMLQVDQTTLQKRALFEEQQMEPENLRKNDQKHGLDKIDKKQVISAIENVFVSQYLMRLPGNRGMRPTRCILCRKQNSNWEEGATHILAAHRDELAKQHLQKWQEFVHRWCVEEKARFLDDVPNKQCPCCHVYFDKLQEHLGERIWLAKESTHVKFYSTDRPKDKDEDRGAFPSNR